MGKAKFTEVFKTLRSGKDCRSNEIRLFVNRNISGPNVSVVKWKLANV